MIIFLILNKVLCSYDNNDPRDLIQNPFPAQQSFLNLFQNKYFVKENLNLTEFLYKVFNCNEIGYKRLGIYNLLTHGLNKYVDMNYLSIHEFFSKSSRVLCRQAFFERFLYYKISISPPSISKEMGALSLFSLGGKNSELCHNEHIKLEKYLEIFYESYCLGKNISRVKFTGIDKKIVNTVTITSFIEHLGILYLRLLSRVRYVRRGSFFSKDIAFFTLMFFNLTYEVFEETRFCMYSFEVFKIFLRKNLKIFLRKNLKIFFIFKRLYQIIKPKIASCVAEQDLSKCKTILMEATKNYCNDEFEKLEMSQKKKVISYYAFNHYAEKVNHIFTVAFGEQFYIHLKDWFAILDSSDLFNMKNIDNFVLMKGQMDILDFFTQDSSSIDCHLYERRNPVFYLNSIKFDALPTNNERLNFFIEKLKYYDNNVVKYYADIYWNVYLKYVDHTH